MTILKMDSVSYQYNSLQENVLNQITASFEEGKFYAIVGKSGAGKSTLLSLLAGLDTPTSGEILFNNQDISEKGYNYHRSHQISLVFQNYNLIDYLTPLENLKLVSSKANKDILLQLGLEEEQIKRNIMKLSGGQQQRVAIARALVSEAPIILADEPTGNLDAANEQNIIELLKRINEELGITIITVTHSDKVANSMQSICTVVDGKIEYVRR